MGRHVGSSAARRSLLVRDRWTRGFGMRSRGRAGARLSIDRQPTHCAFVPRYASVSASGPRRVEALICPHCSEIEFSIGDRRAAITARSEILSSALELLSLITTLRDDEAKI